MSVRTGQTLQAIDLDEIDVLTFEFSPALLSGEAIQTASVACTVHSGTDATPAAVLVGLHQVSGTTVLQQVQGNVSGVTYHLRCIATLNSGRALVAAGYLPCVTL